MIDEEQYKICKERGHTPGHRVLTCNPPKNICKHCGVVYRYEAVIVEDNPPSVETMKDE